PRGAGTRPRAHEPGGAGVDGSGVGGAGARPDKAPVPPDHPRRGTGPRPTVCGARFEGSARRLGVDLRRVVHICGGPNRFGGRSPVESGRFGRRLPTSPRTSAGGTLVGPVSRRSRAYARAVSSGSCSCGSTLL